MEHLTKQQIVLLTLFTSFVTSIATGIVTVALMDQAPVGVTNTINRVIEHTIEEVGPSTSVSGANQSASAANAAAAGSGGSGGGISNGANQIENATALAQKSLVRIMLGNNVTGMGIIVASSGVIVSDKSAIATYGNYIGITSTGAQYPLQVIQTQNNGDLVFLIAGNLVTATSTVPTQGTFTPANFASILGANMPRLGETVISLSADSAADLGSVNEGIIQKINLAPDINGLVSASSTVASFSTNIAATDIAVGSPLFDATGALVGIKTLSNLPGNFYPVGYLQSIIPSL